MGCAGIGIGVVLGLVSRMPRIQMLDEYSPPGVTRVYDRTGDTKLIEYSTERRELVELEEIPQHVVNAFIAIEDERFYSHAGIDLTSVARAIKADVQSGEKAQGASTITMQVARNVVLQQRLKSWKRKFRELLTALQIERQYSKNQILEFYLNQIFFGAGAYGIEAASETYFDKNVKDLTVPEAALLAALPKAPSDLSPFRHKQAAIARRDLVLANMRRLGYIKTDEELREFEQTPIELHPRPASEEVAPYYADYVRSVMMKDRSMEATSDLGEKPYKVISSVDLQLQRICEQELSKGLRQVQKMIEPFDEGQLAEEEQTLGPVMAGQTRLARITGVTDNSVTVQVRGFHAKIPLPDKPPYFNPQEVLRKGNVIDITVHKMDGKTLDCSLSNGHVQGAAVLINPRTGEILALVGGDDFADVSNDGQWNRAAQGGRQPGSSWKPLLYASAFDQVDSNGAPRFTPGTVEMDEPVSVGNWSPKNYEGNYLGPMALFDALVHSRNVPTVRLFLDIGAKRAVSLYHKFNIVNIPSNWDLPAVAPMALGTPNITPLELTAAYSVFANGGVGIRPIAIKLMVNTADRSDVTAAAREKVNVLSPQAAYMTARIMQDVIRIGTAKETIGKWMQEQTAKGRRMPEMAGKTGTTNDCVVAWFIGYTPDLVLGIYAGYDHMRSLGPKMTGSRVAGPIWAAAMDRILQTRTDWKPAFDVPPGIEFADMCSKSGELMTEACAASGDDVFPHAAFKQGTAPTRACSYHGGSRIAAP